MPTEQSLPWVDPIELTMKIMSSESVNISQLVLLHSSVQTTYSGQYSYLAFDPLDTIEANDFAALEDRLKKAPEESLWFGYLGYGLKNSLETLPDDNRNWYHCANLTMTRFSNVLRFDHILKSIDILAGIYPHWVNDNCSAFANETMIKCSALASNMSKSSYQAKVAKIIERIRNGDLYQANLTRKFTGTLEENVNPIQIFKKLCEVSPAPYSAFIKLEDTHIVSSSPELFLTINDKSNIRTRPIKGTSPRKEDQLQDLKSKELLESSAKDRAENLMIVDLMRNDLSRSCEEGSVITSQLFEITSHANVHHMSSTISGKIKESCGSLQAIANCFPPGSMTGAPKIKAMNVCSELEEIERGIYSGAIGWLSNNGSCELSVVIRTLIIQGNRFEFQVGGGITADSTPEAEWQETLDKAKGILLTLGLSADDLLF